MAQMKKTTKKQNKRKNNTSATKQIFKEVLETGSDFLAEKLGKQSLMSSDSKN